MIPRSADESRLRTALGRAPVVLLTGPRQCGKSTLARKVVVPERAHLFDLEDPRDAVRLSEPVLVLRDMAARDTIVIDEAQRHPGLFPVLRVLVDELDAPGRFVVLGCASPDLVGMASESLAGRVEMIELGGFRVADVGVASIDNLWERGGFPRSFLAGSPHASVSWREQFVRTFLERDLADLGVRVPAATMRRFWTMLAHYHGQTWNGSEIARALGVSQPTVRRYVDALTDALVVRQVQPWFANVSKRQVRAPKVYVRDSGLLHALLGIRDQVALLGHPKVGASWEGFVIEQLVTALDVQPYYWATYAGAEIDLLLHVGGRRIGIEIKRTAEPRLTPSMRHALDDLELDRLIVVHAGTEEFPLAERIPAVPVAVVLARGLAAAG